MSPPVHSLRVDIATFETTPLVREHPGLRRDAYRTASAVSCCVARFVAITSSRIRGNSYWPSDVTFYCSPTCAATSHSETTIERSIGSRGTCLLASPHQLGWEIPGGRSRQFALPEDPVEEGLLRETQVELP